MQPGWLCPLKRRARHTQPARPICPQQHARGEPNKPDCRTAAEAAKASGAFVLLAIAACASAASAVVVDDGVAVVVLTLLAPRLLWRCLGCVGCVVCFGSARLVSSRRLFDVSSDAGPCAWAAGRVDAGAGCNAAASVQIEAFACAFRCAATATCDFCDLVTLCDLVTCNCDWGLWRVCNHSANQL